MTSAGPRQPTVLCVGMLTFDVVHVVERMPEANEKVPGLGQSLSFGGPAANAAATAAALGGQVDLVAGFGRSVFTDLVATQLEVAGVRWHDHATDVASASALSTILLTRGTGDRAVVGGAAPPLPADATLPAELVERADVVLLDGHAMPLARQAADRGHRAGIPVVLDGGSYKTGTEALLADVDLAILSADFHPPGGDDALGWVRAHGCPSAAQSAGPGPLVLRDDTGTTAIDIPAGPVVDTLGAGDVLHGAAAYAVGVRGLADLPAVLRFATQLASLSCRYAGALGWAADPTGRAAAHRLSTAFIHTAVDKRGQGSAKSNGQ